ncbi:hypothetical protein EVAR_14559_1 [Eumeta japonica]|uniref:Uncharacterized protein n=1 Tax=Eumeta variegata TaxID=151549 RepID=A0A4C1U3D2_EUMVA|nr:hypothetical protein EVAR_14559_1 [Eumeta japonica]
MPTVDVQTQSGSQGGRCAFIINIRDPSNSKSEPSVATRRFSSRALYFGTMRWRKSSHKNPDLIKENWCGYTTLSNIRENRGTATEWEGPHR